MPTDEETSDGYWRIVKHEGLSGAARNTANRVGLSEADSEAEHGWIRTSYGLKRSGQAGLRRAERVVGVAAAGGGGGDVSDAMLYLALAFAVAGAVRVLFAATARALNSFAVPVPDNAAVALAVAVAAAATVAAAVAILVTGAAAMCTVAVTAFNNLQALGPADSPMIVNILKAATSAVSNTFISLLALALKISFLAFVIFLRSGRFLFACPARCGLLFDRCMQNDGEADDKCGICCDRRRDCTLGCGHRLCLDCANQLTNCPLCNAPIGLRIRTYP